MRRVVPAVFLASVLGFGLVAASEQRPAAPAAPAAAPQAAPPSQPETPRPAPMTPVTSRAAAPAPAPAADQNAVLKQYCVTCHSDRAKAGGLTLASFDVAKAAEHDE